MGDEKDTSSVSAEVAVMSLEAKPSSIVDLSAGITRTGESSGAGLKTTQSETELGAYPKLCKGFVSDANRVPRIMFAGWPAP